MTTPDDIAQKWLSAYDDLEVRGQAFKDSQSVAFGLLELYDSLAPEEQEELLPILGEWLTSEDNKQRYDAAFIASERRVVGLSPAIAAAIERLEQATGPEAFYERKKLRRILEELKP